jgi:hypothetical protein
LATFTVPPSCASDLVDPVSVLCLMVGLDESLSMPKLADPLLEATAVTLVMVRFALTMVNTPMALVAPPAAPPAASAVTWVSRGETALL